MAEQFNRIWFVWKLVIFKVITNSIVIAGTGYLAAMHSTKWANLDGEDRFCLILGLVIAVLKYIDGFLDKTVSKINSGQLTPPDMGDTVQITRESTIKDSVTTSTPQPV
jgi:hypothetical protein